MTSTPTHQKPRRTPSLSSLASLSNNPPPITLWPTIFPPSGSLTPLLTSTSPKQKIQALSTVLILLTPFKKFITAAANTAPSTTAFTTPSTIALSTAVALSNLLPQLLDERHPIALAKTARLAAELSSSGISSAAVAEKLYETVLDERNDRTSRAAAASALVSCVSKGRTDHICNEFSKSLGNPLAPVAEMLAVLRAAVMECPKRFLLIWQNASDVLNAVLNDSAVGLHAVRLVQAFISALLEKENCHDVLDDENGIVEEGVYELLPTVYDTILVTAVKCDNQPMQLAAIAAVDAFQQLSLAKSHRKFSGELTSIRTVLSRLSTDATIPVRSAALRALGNHPAQFEEIFNFLVETPSTPTLPCAKAFSAASVLLEKMVINEEVLAVVEGYMRAAIGHISVHVGEMSKAEKTMDESLRVACLAFLGVAIVRLGECQNGDTDVLGVEEAIRAVMKSAREGSVNVRVHACKSLGRVLQDGGHECSAIIEFLCFLLVPHSPVRVMMASTRALLRVKDMSTLQGGLKLLMVEGCLTCSKAQVVIGDTRARALRQALRRLLGELVVRAVEAGLAWHGGVVQMVQVVDLYDCVAVYYRLPGFLKNEFEQGSDQILEAFPEEARFVVRRLLEMREV